MGRLALKHTTSCKLYELYELCEKVLPFKMPVGLARSFNTGNTREGNSHMSIYYIYEAFIKSSPGFGRIEPISTSSTILQRNLRIPMRLGTWRQVEGLRRPRVCSVLWLRIYQQYDVSTSAYDSIQLQCRTSTLPYLDLRSPVRMGAFRPWLCLQMLRRISTRVFFWNLCFVLFFSWITWTISPGNRNSTQNCQCFPVHTHMPIEHVMPMQLLVMLPSELNGKLDAMIIMLNKIYQLYFTLYKNLWMAQISRL